MIVVPFRGIIEDDFRTTVENTSHSMVLVIGYCLFNIILPIIKNKVTFLGQDICLMIKVLWAHKNSFI